VPEHRRAQLSLRMEHGGAGSEEDLFESANVLAHGHVRPTAGLEHLEDARRYSPLGEVAGVSNRLDSAATCSSERNRETTSVAIAIVRSFTASLSAHLNAYPLPLMVETAPQFTTRRR
jgi:hypothetical protein